MGYCECPNQFNPENRFVGDIEDGKSYPFGCYTKEEADARFAPISAETDISALVAEVATKASEAEAVEIRSRLDHLEMLDIFVTPEMFGAVGDGETDDTEAIQAAVDTGKTVYINGRFKTGKIVLNNDNQTVVFGNGTEIIGDYSDPAGTPDNTSGLFMISGTVKNATPEIVEISENQITLSSVAGIEVGDFIEINVPVASNPNHNVLEVISIYGNVVTCDTNFMQFTDNTDYSVTIVKPIRNVRLEGNGTTITLSGDTTYTHHIMVKYGEYCEVSGFNTIYGGGHGCRLMYCISCTIRDMLHNYSTNNTAGHGYGASATFSHDVLIKGCKTMNARHAVDFAACVYNSVIDSCIGINSQISMHGMNACYNTVIDCEVVGSNYMVGNYTFVSDHDIKFIRCKCSVTSDSSDTNHCFAIGNASYNIDIIDCTITDFGHSSIYIGNSQGVVCHDITIKGCMFKNTAYIAINKACYNINIIDCVFDGCNAAVKATGENDYFISDIKIQNVTVKNEINSDVASFNVSHANNTVIKNCHINAVNSGIFLVTCSNSVVDNCSITAAADNAIYNYSGGNALIMNCDLLDGDIFSVQSKVPCTVTNCKIAKMVLIQGDGKGIVLSNNFVGGKLNLNTTDGICSLNYGTAAQFSVQMASINVNNLVEISQGG